MLHYYMHDGPAAFRFELAGDLGANDAATLDQDWRTASSTMGDRGLIVDVSFVTSIDEAGLSLLRRWHAAGAQFAAISPQSRELVETITGHPFSPQQRQEPTYRPWFSTSLRSLQVTLPAITIWAVLTLLTPSVAWAADDGASLAFARYVSMVGGTRTLADSSDVVIEIDASLPKLAKQAHMEAIRHLGASGEAGYEILTLAGDSTVKHEVIARYLAIEQQAYTMPASSFAVTPENYKFRYTGSIEGGGNQVYVFTIKPRNHREGLMEGQIWIDRATGTAVRQVGRLLNRKSIFIKKITVARDAGSRADAPYVRITKIEIETRLFGRAELTIRERPQTSILSAGYQQ
jgi:ABC-type transporter Mla MlaB component